MASRRAAPTRSRTAGTMAPPSATSSRPKSVLSKSNSSQRSGLTTPVEENFEAGPSGHQARTRVQSSQHGKDDSETNIQVVIRCRRRSEREMQESSPIVVTTNGPKAQDITIETAAPVSSFGVVTLPPTRTYPFDMVFGPEADQAMIYHDVVSPMLDEVLQGYNCTLFAYGQTGTGKTYTMQGDLTPTALGNPSPQAGMIPRVLFRLFHQLESSGTDYSVKISFVELYNEELRDLLAPELPAPTGSAQPMGMGASKDGVGSLKIFDDASKKGVFIQGLEEACVKDTPDALALLTKGSHRRQTAATKFNDHSSRSHSVFSITVHIKETSTMGDDLLKVGKLNLVDLAGSENIGRSGAENKRAREAGMINQSLLTLGRVINALVDRSSHVPYRESKLTRLLQDSLGGRTKTCIIATVSPARSNMEETLSTLDYAMHAKSIRNKPEVNQRMSRNALLKEYIAEIERLKADLLAAREKNGIFFSEETYNQMTMEQELKETEMQEAKKQIAILESQLRNVREEFDQSIALFMKSESELKETKERLQERESELVVKDGQLRAVEGALEEEVVVRKAFQDNEGVLDGIASSLKSVARQSVSDVGRLFGKLERKSSISDSNVKAVFAHTRTLSTETQTFSLKLDDFVKIFKQHVSQLKTEAEQYKTRELEILASTSVRISEQIEKVPEALKVIHAKDQDADEAISAIQMTVEEMQESVKSGFNSWAEDLKVHYENTCKQIEDASMASCSTLEKAFKSLGSMLEAVIQEAQDYISTERKSLQEAKALADSTSEAEKIRLRQQNALLTRLYESEKLARDELQKRISGLLGDYTAERDRSLRETFSEMTESNGAAEEGMVRLGKQQGQRLDAVVSNGREWCSALDKRSGELKRTRDGGFKALGTVSTALHDSLSGMQAGVSTSVSTYSTDLQRQTQSLSTTFNSAYDRISRAKRARIDTTDAMVTEAQSGYRYMQRSIASTSRNVESLAGRVMSEASAEGHAVETYATTASTHLFVVGQTTQALSEQGTREDMPTGTTPRKRSWEYTDRWHLTKRDAIIKNWRKQGISSTRSDTFLPEHLPLPSGNTSDSGSESGRDAESDCEPESPIDEPEEDDTVTINSPPYARSLASSTSSSTTASSIPTTTSSVSDTMSSDLKRPVATLKSGLPTMGTLTERSTNVLGVRGMRRTRR